MRSTNCILTLIGLGGALVFSSPAQGVSITGTQGVFQQGSAVTISGSSFGTKVPAAPIKFEDFENGTYDSDWTFELNGWNAISIVGTNNHGVSMHSAEMNTYSNAAANFSWIEGQPPVQTMYVNYWIKKHFTWGSNGEDAWDNVKVNRFKSNQNQSNAYYVFHPCEDPNGFYGALEFASSPNSFTNQWDYATEFSNDTWHSLETTYKVTSSPGGFMKCVFDGKVILNSTGLDFDADSYVGFGIGLARVRVNNLLPTDRYWLDDIYIDNTQARVMIGNSPGFATCTHLEIQIPTAWSSDQISIQANQGSFQNGSPAYLFVIDAAGNVSNGYAINIGGSVPSDTTPPAAVTTLVAAASTQTTVNLAWTAVGDDGSSGTASQYDVRYSTYVINAGNWASATQVSGEPTPHLAGTAEAYTVMGLTPGTTYYFALKVADEVPNWSSLSNVPNRATQPPAETSPPAGVTTLAVGSTTQTTALLAWTAVGDDGNSGTASQYDIRYSTGVINVGNWSSATQVTGEPLPLPAGTSQNFTVTGLLPATTYYFAMKVADEVPNWSGLSNVASGTTQPSLESPDECTSPPPSWVFCSGFEEGNLDLWDDWDGNPPETNTILEDPGPANLPGNHAMRLRVPPGEGTADLVKVLPDSYDRLYVRWYVKWEDGYNFGAANHGGGLHAGSRNYLGRSGYRPNGNDWFSGWIEPQTVDSRLNVYTYYRGMYQDCADPNGSCWGDHFPCMMDEGQVYCTKPADRETILPPQMVTGRWYCIEMMMDGGTASIDGSNANGILDFWIDGVEYGPWDDLWLRTTANLKLDVLWLSLYHHGQHSVEGMMIDNVVVSTQRVGPLGVVPDLAPPSPVTTLAVGSTTQSSAALSWTAVGDDGTTGTATTYDLRYSTSAINASNWNSASQANGEPVPHAAGQPETFTVTGLAAGTTYYFALKVADEVPNWSGLSNVPSGATQPFPDTTSPAAVTTLAIGSTTQTTASLTWTAVGDDANSGTATTYDLRYSTSSINASNFASATQVSGEPAPHAAGQSESFTVTGLNAGTTYYFALKVADEVPNWSGLSNVPSGTTQPASDTTPPAAVTTLAVGSTTPTTAALTWTAVGDNGNSGTATTYDLRYSTSSINASNFASATQVSGEPAPHAAGQAESFTVTGLNAGTTYYFALKVADEVPNWSGLSNVPNGTTQPAPDTTPPAAVTTLAVGSTTPTTAALTWTAVGDDANSGTAATYDLRYSTSSINASNFASATQVSGEPAPHAAGQAESFTVTGLNAGTTYYFALKVADEVPNWSGLSNVPNGTTQPAPDTTPPAAVTTLAVGSTTPTTAALTWTAVGDDGNSGTAATYDLRYSTSIINASNFASATQVSGEPAPHAAGQAESFTVTGLNAGTTYYFALKVADEVPNWSGLSNVPNGTTQPAPDTTPPAAVTTLAVGSTTPTTAALTWTAVGDDGNSGTAATYDLRYSTSSINASNFASAIQVSGEPTPHAAGQSEGYTVTGLNAGTTYYFALKVADEAPNWGALSNVPNGTTQPAPDVTPPAAVTTLAVGSTTQTTATLIWTAVGDDGNSGTATSYDLRYSTAMLTEGNWSSATQVSGEPMPHAAGQSEAFAVTGLNAGTTYYFAIKVGDEVPNWSGLSNVPNGATPPVPDTTPPAAVTTLAVGLTTQTTATLTWTAVGDDGNSGTATTYDLRYSTSSINAGNFASATQVTGEPAPHAAGQSESSAVTGLSAGTTYYFALKVADEVPNWSDLSNVPNGTTLLAPDTTPPSAVTTLAVGLITQTAATLTWTAVGDDGNSGTATTYDLRYSTSNINAGNFASATQVSGEPAPHAAGQPESFTVTGLAAGTAYYFALKVADEVPNWSGLSNVPSGTTPPMPDTTPPATVTTLAVGARAQTSVVLAWTAVGDDGNSGSATSYDLRYSTTTITEGNWSSATQLTGEPAPKPAGQAESFSVAGLNPNTTYYFALKVADEVPNWSGLSNVPQAATLPVPDTTPPAAVTTLAVGSRAQTSIVLNWTSVGDDGNSGTATTYDLRYSTSAINGGNFGSATQVSGEPAPKQAGQGESFSVTGLTPNTTYYFALKVADEVPNWSGLSNLPSGATLPPSDVTPPAAVTNLAITLRTSTTVTLAWTAVGDDGNSGTATSYDLRYSISPITPANWSSASPAFGESLPKPAGQPESFTLLGLNPYTTYYFALKVSDEVPNVSGLSNVPSGRTLSGQDATPPANVTSLVVASTTSTTATLTWTAVGDDGFIGRATGYDIRYATSAINRNNWSAAFQVSGEPVPGPSGSAETFTVTGLTAGTTYYFVIKVRDEVPNWTGLSNVPSGTTQPPAPSPSRPDLFYSNLQLVASTPNPFTSQIWLTYSLPAPAPVRLLILDASGGLIRILRDGEAEDPGSHAILWDGDDANGREAPNGIYFVRLLANGAGVSGKILKVN